MRILLCSIASIVLSASASLASGLCHGNDWQDIGFQDGIEGLSAGHFAVRQRACFDLGLEANKPSWDLGYAAGLKLYCTSVAMLGAGSDGRLSDVCSASSLDRLIVDDPRGLINRRPRQDITQANRKIDRITDLLEKPGLQPSQRSGLVAERAQRRLQSASPYSPSLSSGVRGWYGRPDLNRHGLSPQRF